MIEDDFTVIIDTREQLPWEFGLHTTAKKKLDTGDYSIEGLEHLLCIERKKSVSEIANNISEKRFKDVLERMSKMTYPFMLFEFDLEDIYSFPVGSDIPKKLWDSLKISANYILKYITLIQLNYGVHILFCGGPENAEKMAVSIMKRVYEKHRDQQNTI
jgi:ERCC4-type nuclease